MNDVVAIEVLDQLHHSIVQSDDDDLNLLACGDELNHLLQSSCAMGVQCNLNHLWSGVVDQDGTLLIIGKLEKLLAEIVAKCI